MKKIVKYVRNMNSITSHGLEIAMTGLEANGYKILSEDDNISPVATTVYWYDQIWNLIKYRFANTNRSRKILVGGNIATVNPSALVQLGFDVFLGDGELCDDIYDSPYIITGDNLVGEKANSAKIKQIKYIETQTQSRQFMEISRGCKNKCMFCQYTWLKPYVEQPAVNIKNFIDEHTEVNNFKVCCADRFQHSEYHEIRNLMDGKGLNDTGSDASLKSMGKNGDEYFSITRSGKVQTGIEGMSYRLRKMVGKPFNDDFIINIISMMAKYEHHRLDVYMIYGLPTETDSDIEEFDNLLNKIDKSLRGKKFNIVIHWNAFTPSAMTPMQWESCSAYKYKYTGRLKKLMTEYKYENIDVVHRPKMTGDDLIFSRMLANRCSNKSAHILYNAAMNTVKMKRPKYVEMFLKEFEKAEGYNLFDQMSIEMEMPYERHISNIDSALLRKMANKFRRLPGAETPGGVSI